MGSTSGRARHHKKSSVTASGKSDLLLAVAVIALSLFGLLMVYNASVAIAIRDFDDRFHFIREQGRWFMLGMGAFLVMAKIPYRTLFRFAAPLLFTTIGLLLLVFVPGLGIKALGAKRWIDLGFTVIQPAEFAKLSMVIFFSAWLSNREEGRLLPFLLVLGTVAGLIVLEPDLGTTIVLSITAIVLYFVSGARLRDMALIVPVGAVLVLALAVTSPYRMGRLLTFINPDRDPQGASYQIRQALIAIGSGGLGGLGLGKSRQKYAYLPEANTDSIFAIISEEVGFLGSAFVLFLILFIVYRGYRIAIRAPDQFGSLMAFGIISWYGFQSALNIGAISGLLPLTGIPLPLVSYGGSNLIIMMTAFGILMNISRSRI